MRSATVSKWLQENANAPPPPATPSGLPDDSASTVYPESSVSNPYASRYTGSRHRTAVMQQYPDRRPTSAQGHRRDRDHYPQYAAPAPTRHRNRSFSADARYMPTQAQPYNYSYSQSQPKQTYYSAPQTQPTYSRPAAQRSHSASRYNVTASSPTRIDVVRPQAARAYTTYANYASTPTIATTPHKKAPLLRRLFGLDWGAKPATVAYTTRASSRSSSKSKSHRSDSKSYNDTYRTTRPRRNSEGVVYLRY